MSKDEELRLVKLVETLAEQNARLAGSVKALQADVQQLNTAVLRMSLNLSVRERV